MVDPDIFLVTLGENPTETPAMWIDAGTHAAEWTGVMSLLYSLEKWARLREGGEGAEMVSGEYDFCCALYLSRWISSLNGRRSISSFNITPTEERCFSSRIRASRYRWRWKDSFMRWRDPAGPYIIDDEADFGIRKRRLDDDPADACFFSLRKVFLLSGME